jgi:hypothetical protein
MQTGTAKFVNEITVTDPDTNLPVELSVFKHSNGGMFAIDSSYYDQVCEENDMGEIILNDPLNDENSEVELI